MDEDPTSGASGEAGFDEVSSEELVDDNTAADAAELTSIRRVAPPNPSSGERKRVLAGKYLLEREIARGAMGHVFLATQINLKRRVAVKVLLPQNSGVDFDRRFLLEAQMAAGLSHRNIVVVHDYGQSKNGLLFMAMEYLNGPTLGRLLARTGPLPVGRACNIILQVARALRCAHRAGVVHRDLKPGNVMIVQGDDEEGEVAKVLDFGLVKVFEREPAAHPKSSDEPLTNDGLMLGTPRYMAPEQIIGKDVDPRSDIYALGALFYRLLTGRHPFEGEHDVEILNAQLKTNPIPLRQQPGCEALPPELEALIAHCMRRKIEERLDSASTFIHRLRDLITVALTDPQLRPLFDVGKVGGLPASALALSSLSDREGSSSGSRGVLHEDIKSSRPRLDGSGVLQTPDTPMTTHLPDSVPPSPAPQVETTGMAATSTDHDLGANQYEYTTSGPPPRRWLPMAAGIALVLFVLIGAITLLNHEPAPADGPGPDAPTAAVSGEPPPAPPAAPDEIPATRAPPDDDPAPETTARAEDAPPPPPTAEPDDKPRTTSSSKRTSRRSTRKAKARQARRVAQKRADQKAAAADDDKAAPEDPAEETSVSVGDTLLAVPGQSPEPKRRKRRAAGEKVGGVLLASPDDVESVQPRERGAQSEPSKVNNGDVTLADDYQ